MTHRNDGFIGNLTMVLAPLKDFADVSNFLSQINNYVTN